MTRTSISIDEQVFEKFSAQAMWQLKTIFALANESLDTISKVGSEGGSPADLYALWKSVAILKQVDVIALPSDFVDSMVAELYSENRAKLLKMFYDLGSSLVMQLKMFASNLTELTSTAKNLARLMPLKRLTVKDLGGVLEVDIAGAGRKRESTECTFEFVKAILDGYGYTVTKHEMSVGALRIWVARKEQPRSF